MQITDQFQTLIDNRNTALKNVLEFLEQKNPVAFSRAMTRYQGQLPEGIGEFIQPGELQADVLGAVDVETVEAPGWNDMFKDLFKTAVQVKATTSMDESEQRALELELSKIQAQNAAIDKQIELRRQMAIPTVTGGARFILGDILTNPMTLVALAGVGWLIFMRRGRRK